MRSPVEQQRLKGTEIELARQVVALRATRGEVSTFEPRRLPDGRWSVVVLVPRRTRADHAPALVAAGTLVAVATLTAVGWLMYLRTASLFATALRLAIPLGILAGVWWLLGRTGHCPGIHCPGCRCGGAR